MLTMTMPLPLPLRRRWRRRWGRRRRRRLGCKPADTVPLRLGLRLGSGLRLRLGSARSVRWLTPQSQPVAVCASRARPG